MSLPRVLITLITICTSCLNHVCQQFKTVVYKICTRHTIYEQLVHMVCREATSTYGMSFIKYDVDHLYIVRNSVNMM